MARQQELRFRTRGGPRKRAGRRAAGPRPIHHDERIRVVPSEPIHVTCRALRRIGSLRRDALHAAIRTATTVVGRHGDFRIIHISIQRSHLHLLVEAESGRALTSGMCSFLISAARHINRAVRARGGRVFERYHARSLGTPREVRNCLSYVLNNWRHHGEHRASAAASRWLVDKYSSGVAFDGWKELGRGTRFITPPDHAALVVWRPRVWLLTTGWLRHGLVSVREVPSGDEDD
jgi:REP element-mobilizing transposase RayT